MMIHLIKGQVNKIILTLSEKATLTSPNWLFYFKSRNTNETVAFVILNNADLSTYQERYNAFNITVSSYFANKLPGEWSYQIYEQTSTSNLIPSNATSMVESGQATLNDTSQFSFTTYSNQTNTYKVRDI
jgi:hypothetical protein